MKDENSLQGTKWKLVGLYNAKTDNLMKFLTVPRDCEDCYTLTFLSDTVVEAVIDKTVFREDSESDLILNLSGSPRPIWASNYGSCGYSLIYSSLLMGMYSYSLNNDQTELRCYVDPSYILPNFTHYEYVLGSPNRNREIFFLYKKYGSFTPEKWEDDCDQQLPPNLKGTRWKLESVYNLPLEINSTVESIGACEECFTFTFVTDAMAYGLMTIGYFGLEFTGNEVRTMMTDADGNEIFAGGDGPAREITEAHARILNAWYAAAGTSRYSISETEMIIKGGCDDVMTFKKL